jgi:hypothetical protein
MDAACVATVKNTFLEFGLPPLQLRRASSAPSPGDELELASTTDGGSEVEEFPMRSRRSSITSCWADEMAMEACTSAALESSSTSQALSYEQVGQEPSNQSNRELLQQSPEIFVPKHRGMRASAEMTSVSSRMSSIELLQLPREAHAMKRQALLRPMGSQRADNKFRFTCRFDVGIEEDSDFRVVRRLLGSEAENMKSIVKKSGGSKIRIHGKGASKDCSNASDDSLHIVVGATSTGRLERAAALVTDLLSRVHAEYEAYCNTLGCQTLIPRICRVDGVALPPDVRASNKH